MALRKTVSLEGLESDDDMYSGFNEVSPALATADIREHGIGILCSGSEGSRHSTPISMRSRRTSLTPQIQRKETFRGFSRLSPSGTVSSVSGAATPWTVETPRCRTDQGKSSQSPTGLTPRPRTDWARRMGTASRLTTACPGTRSGTAQGYRPQTPVCRPYTSFQGTPRPLSTIRAAYYVPSTRSSITASTRGTASDQIRLATNPRSTAILKQNEKSPLGRMKILETQLSQLFVECRQASNPRTALEIAKKAQEKERNLYHIYSNQDHTGQYNTSLTFAVIINLANQYDANGMYKEALNTYQIINKSKNDVFKQPFRVKINMGNLYVKLCQYPLAVKTYNMALDHVPLEFTSLRVKILRNLGVVYFKLNQIGDAIVAFTKIMEEKPNFVVGLNLMACLYALNCEDDMKTCFEVLLATPLKITNDESHTIWDIKQDVDARCLKDVLKYDKLSKLERKLKLEADKIILLSAKIVAVSICDTIFDGYDWCIEKMKSSQFEYLVDEIQITKALKLMNEAQLAPAITLLKELQHGSEAVASAAATNLAFIYLTQQDLDEAEKYSSIACATDCYSSAALVNSGCCYLARGLHPLAKTKFAFAVENDATCFEALYDLGLANKQMGLYVEAMCCFKKLHSMFREDRSVLYQLASIYQLTEDVENAMIRYHQILCLEPKNALILKTIGNLYDHTGDVYQAYQYYLDSYRQLPSQVDVLLWLGIYNLNMGCSEDKAIEYINLAIQCQPCEIKWYLMVGSCHERTGNLSTAKEYYEEIHVKFPDNTECLKHLVKICLSINPQKAKEYALDLKKLERKCASGSGQTGMSPSNRSSTLQISADVSPLCEECVSQTQHALSHPHNESMYDPVNCILSHVSSEAYYSCENGQQTLDGHVKDLSPKLRHTVPPKEPFLQYGRSNEFVVNRPGDLAEERYNRNLRRWLDSKDRFDVNHLRKMPVDAVSSSKFIKHHPQHPSEKKSQPQSRDCVQNVASDPRCSLTEQGCRGYVATAPRMLYSKMVEAHDLLRMSVGDSLADPSQGQHLSCRATPRFARLPSRQACDVGLKIFADSRLGADLLPN